MNPAPTCFRLPALMAAAASVIVVMLVASTLTAAPAGAQPAGLASRAPAGFSFGGVLHAYDASWSKGAYKRVAETEFNAITATAYMPWGPVPNDLDPAVRAPDVPIDTRPLNRLVRWAERRDMLVHGHVLLYPLANQDLDWYQDSQFDGQRARLIKRYIRTMAGSNPGGVDVWDVVNEVIADPYQLENGIEVDEWGLRTDFVEYHELGTPGRDYVERAFAWTDAVVDEDVSLIINEYGAETLNVKSDALLAYVVELKRRGVPIDGVGFQMHLSSVNLDEGALANTMTSMETNLRRFAAAGFELYITELDVQATATSDPQVRPTPAELADQATVYEAVTELALRVPQLNTMLLWDFADDRSWLNPTDRPLGTLPVGTYTHPAPWADGAVGSRLTPKPAYAAIGNAFEGRGHSPSIPSDGAMRLVNGWDPGSGYLTRHGAEHRDGRTIATAEAGLYTLGSDNDDWSSMEWTFEPTGDGYYRIRNTWAAKRGYLGRTATWNGTEWIPASGVFLDRIDPDGWHQQWSVEPAGNGSFALVNRWDPASGVLTRDGLDIGGGNYDPLATVSLYEPADWSSQHWKATQG